MNAYLTVLSSDSYLLGVLALYKSLLETKTNYPFYVAITDDLSKESIEVLKNNNINLIKLDEKIDMPEKIRNKNCKFGYSQWNNTLQKLGIFQLEQFNKIVYIDSDMMILRNIDELFTKEHMSAVVAGALMPGREMWKELNSGVMVIEPKNNLGNNIAKMIYSVSLKKEYFGDQDLIQEYYYDWSKNKELNLDHKYNVFIGDLEYYCKNKGYSIKESSRCISIIHFIGIKKPWMLSKKEIFRMILSLIKNNKINTLKIYISYFRILNRIKKEQN